MKDTASGLQYFEQFRDRLELFTIRAGEHDRVRQRFKAPPAVEWAAAIG